MSKYPPNPIKIWPNMVAAKLGGWERVPAYLIQFPPRIRTEAVMIELFGPNLERVYSVKGDAATNANRKVVLSQAMMEGVVEKNSAEVFPTAANESHCYQLAAVVAIGREGTFIPADLYQNPA